MGTSLLILLFAITYQPPDLWESSRALTKVFTQVENATFKVDNSILKTGEDIATAPMAFSLVPITEASIEKLSAKTLKSRCDNENLVVNCSDQRVLITIERFNLRAFKSIAFLDYQIPVNGSKPDDCDVAWSRDKDINDTIPVIGSYSAFRDGRYLYYSRGGDYRKGMNQYLWSFLCALGEAQYLNRTFVMDLSVCLASSYTWSRKDEEGKDLDWKRWDKTHTKRISVRKVANYKVSPVQLRKDKSTIIWRQFDDPKPEDYWYRVCEGPAGKYIQRPWHALWKSKRLMNIVTEISRSMDWDYDVVHVVSGEKAQNKELWPHLDADTSPDSLVTKLQGLVTPWRNLYVATNEPFYNYFDKLRSHYKVHLLDDYRYLWSNTSEWYNETAQLNNGHPVESDGYMRVEVDTEVLYRAKTQVETFYNLTKDCKDGINTC
ncbi:hypothetical protein RND71_004441 [Anisodus tanguticus]|uniref:O-fucosyltransferase family protein n=1 Tax=Anisodus tanguticus TaxID=243964 RepID=A0AAE1VUC0_9SOLA|nr:hypothetical protein RND71_004441 [Anisodus tanguticus]